MSSFQSQALRTKSDQFNYRPQTQVAALMLLATVSQFAALLDPLKKAIFYGKPYVASDEVVQIISAMKKDDPDLHNDLSENTDLHDHIDLFHAILGKATELSEMIVPFLSHVVDGDPLDKTNLAEEFGDDMWYTALGLNALGVDMDEQGQKIINKLRIRFPEKFTGDLAINRNPDVERTVL